MPLLLHCLPGHAREPWVIGVEGLIDEIVFRVFEAILVEAHALSEFAEQGDVASGLPHRGDGLLRQLREEVPIGALNIFCLQKGRRGEQDVGVVRRIGKELFVDDGEQVFAAHSPEHIVLVGSDDGGIGVVDEQGLDRRAANSRVAGCEGLAETDHVYDSRGAA